MSASWEADEIPLWNQLQADIYNRPVDTLKTKTRPYWAQPSALGPVWAFQRYPRRSVHMVAVDKTYEPNPQKRGAL